MSIVCLQQQLIATTVYRNDVAGVVGFRFELGAKFRDVIVNRAGYRKLVVAPDVAQQLFAAHDFVAMRDQVSEQLELARRKSDAAPLARHEALPEADGHVPKREFLTRQRMPIVAPDLRTHAREQFAHAEGLAHVVVCPEVETMHPIAFVGSSGEHDDWYSGATS